MRTRPGIPKIDPARYNRGETQFARHRPEHFMTNPSPDGSNGSPFTIPAIKLLLVALFACAVWPIPAMIAQTNPAEAVVWGRYTLKYFLLLGAYCVMTAMLGVALAWALIRLSRRRLEDVRSWLADRPLLSAAGFALSIGGLAGVRALVLAQAVILNRAIRASMNVVPGLAIFLLAGLAALVVDRRLAQRIERRLASLQEAEWARWVTRRRAALIVGLAATALAFLAVALDGEYWNYPLTIDSSVHIYLGQHVLRGGVPYRTFIYMFPPGRYIVSLLWSLGAGLTGLPIVHFVRGVELAVGVGVLGFTYLCGRELTGHRLGGALAAAILLGIEHLQEVVIYGPTFRMTTALLMLAGLWLGQRRRWLWAGVLTMLAASLWPPAGAALIAVGIGALLQSEEPRGRAFLLTLAGGLSVAAVTAIGLLIAGIFDEAYRQIVVSVLGMFTDRYVQPAIGDAVGGRLRLFHWYVTVFEWNLRGDWELAALMILGPPVVLLGQGARGLLARPERSVLLLTFLGMAGATALDFDGSMRDSLMLLSSLVPYGAEALVGAFLLVEERLDLTLYALRRFAGVAALAAVLVVGLADSRAHERFLYSIATISLSDQQQMADELEAVLKPGQQVLTMGNYWYLTLSGRDGILPVRWLSYKANDLEVTGWTAERLRSEIERLAPVVVMWNGPDETPAWLYEGYDYMGDLDPNNSGFEQPIFVREGNPAIEAVIAGWPLRESQPGEQPDA